MTFGAILTTVNVSYAVGGTCSSVVQKKNVPYDIDPSRVRAICSSLEADSKAQGVLDRTAGGDGHTPWFTQLNTYKYSGYYKPPIRGSYVKIARV